MLQQLARHLSQFLVYLVKQIIHLQFLQQTQTATQHSLAQVIKLQHHLSL
jgi:hypothetical protein